MFLSTDGGCGGGVHRTTAQKGAKMTKQHITSEQIDPVLIGERCPGCGGSDIRDVIDYRADNGPDIFQCRDCGFGWDVTIKEQK